MIFIGLHAGADPGFRRGGGGSYIQKGGGFVQEFQEGIQIVAGPWANQQAKKNADSRRGGGVGSDDPKKTPVSAHDMGGCKYDRPRRSLTYPPL